MSADHYRIVFDGELAPGISLEAAKHNLAELFRVDVSKVERLFGQGPVSIKRNLSAPEADRYLEALQRAGACARKEPEAMRATTLSLIEDRPPQKPQSEQMACPKCGHAQPIAPLCQQCGIVIQKYLARQAQQAEASKQNESQDTTHPYAPPRAQVGEPMAEFGTLKVFSLQGRIGRLRYLAWSAVMMAAATGLWVVIGAALGMSVVLGSLLAFIAGLGILLASTLIGVQRLHDIGWSGWLMLLNLVPGVGAIFPLVMLLAPGNEGANRFGPPQPPNTRAVRILAALWLLVPLIAILAALVIPAYQ